MVAPSFQKLNQIGEPYEVSGKMYVKLENPKTGNVRQARWYTEDEYNKTFKPVEKEKLKVDWNYKKALGFEKGDITIFKDGHDMDDEWFSASTARYSTVWGWYFTSEMEVPKDLPAGACPVHLPWSMVSEDGRTPNATEKVRTAVQKLLYGDSVSSFQGAIGDRLEKFLRLNHYSTYQTQYGNTYIYQFTDRDGNAYTWTTSARRLDIEVEYCIRGTVKEHKINKGVETTVLTRCMVR